MACAKNPFDNLFNHSDGPGESGFALPPGVDRAPPDRVGKILEGGPPEAAADGPEPVRFFAMFP